MTLIYPFIIAVGLLLKNALIAAIYGRHIEEQVLNIIINSWEWKMFLKWKIFNHRMMFYSRRVYRTGGINSITPDKLHIPMFDLDNCNIRELETEISLLQDAFQLGDCLIVTTGKPDSYHVYFMNKVSWRQAILIGVSCRFVDLKHIQFSLKRKHFTLRLLDKAGRKPTLYNTIYSRYPNTLNKNDLKSFVLYETANK